MFHQDIKQVACTAPVDGGNGIDLSQSQFIENIGIIATLIIIHLIDCQQYWLVNFSEHPRHRFIQVSNTA